MSLITPMKEILVKLQSKKQPNKTYETVQMPYSFTSADIEQYLKTIDEQIGQYKFYINQSSFIKDIENMIKMVNLNEEETITIEFDLLDIFEKPDFEIENKTLISQMQMYYNKIYFSDFTGNVKFYDINSKKIMNIYKDQCAVLDFIKTENFLIVVNEKNEIFLNSNQVHKAEEKIISISYGNDCIYFATKSSKIFTVNLSTLQIDLLTDEISNITKIFYLNENLMISSLTDFFIIYDIINKSFKTINTNFPCTTFDYKDIFFIGSSKGKLAKYTETKDLIFLNADCHFITHIYIINQNLLIYSSQYSIFIYNLLTNETLNKIDVECEISGLVWHENILFYSFGTKINGYRFTKF